MDATGNCICDSAANFTMSPASVCVCISGLFLNASGAC
jgi:hypothetical protein